MSINLLLGTLRQRSLSLFWYVFTLVAYGWMMVWYWPLMGESYSQLIESMPPELIQAFAGANVDLTTVGGFMQTEYLGIMWIGIAGSALILFASKAVAGEIGSGTMELLLTQPISRLRFVSTRIAGLVVWVAALCVATVAPIQLLGPTYDIDLPAERYLLLYGLSAVFMLAIGGIAFLVSAASRDGGKPAAVTGGLLGAMWVLHAIAGLADFAESLEPFNLLKYWQPASIIDKGTVSPESWWVLGMVALVTLFASVVVFVRRDVA